MNKLAYEFACGMLAKMPTTDFLTPQAKELAAKAFAECFADFNLDEVPKEAFGHPVEAIIQATLKSSWNCFTGGFHIASELIHETEGGAVRRALH